MSIELGLSLARISRRCGVDFATVPERYIRDQISPRRPSATVNVGLGHRNFLCHSPCAVFFSSGNVLDNATNGALTLRVSSIRLSALIQVASSSLASSGENTSGGTCQEFVRTRRSRPARGKNPRRRSDLEGRRAGCSSLRTERSGEINRPFPRLQTEPRYGRQRAGGTTHNLDRPARIAAV